MAQTHLAACAACTVIDQDTAPTRADIMISVPDVHCASCITAIESALVKDPRVGFARVNLSLRRVLIETNDAGGIDDFIKIIKNLGYRAFALDATLLEATSDKDQLWAYTIRLGVAAFAMMNVMLLSVSVWAGALGAARDLFHWISALIATPAILFSGQPFYKSAYQALRHGKLNMDVPITLAILLALGMSLYETTHFGLDAYFDAALSLTFFLLAGRYLEQRMRLNARTAAKELAALESHQALLVDGSHVAVSDLVVGDCLRILPGVRIPVDVQIIQGSSDTDQSILSGESAPIIVNPGDHLAAGCLNLTGAIEARAITVGENTSLRQMMKLVAIAEMPKTRYSSLADRAAQIYAPLVHLIALLAFSGWMLATHDVRLSMIIAISTLIITCPCALGLAVPAVNTVAVGHLFSKKVLLKHETALERLALVDHIVFDKTGTLTDGHAKLAKISGAPDLAIVLALAMHSLHPLSKALAHEIHTQDPDLVPVPLDSIHESPGRGVEGLLPDGRVVRLGAAAWLGQDPVSGVSVHYHDGQNSAIFHFTDSLNKTIEPLIRRLFDAGYAVDLLSGDRMAAVSDVAKTLGITHIHAEKTPEEKMAYIESLQEKGKRVLMIGDGLNDTGALSVAYASISPAHAMEVARVASDAVILSEDLGVIWDMLVTAKNARRRILENFAIAAIYNAVSIPLAIMGYVSPLIAALAMSTSSILVTLNATRVRGAK